jgi:secreted trypsin-like serine protease
MQHVRGELDFFTSGQERSLITNTRLVIGRFADRARHPYYTNLEVTFGNWWYSYSGSCGGSMIARDVVLTAAHCLKDADGFPVHSITMHVNRTSLVETSSYEYERSATYFFVHQDYDSNSIQNDIGLVLLDVPIPASVRLVNLNRDSSITVTGQSLIAFGLSLVQRNGSDQIEAEYLMEA